MARRTPSSRTADSATDDAAGESKSAQTKARILAAAAHVLSTKGYAGLRLTEVATRADVQAPAIYYYYSSRDELIEEVMWAGIADMREHVVDALAALPDTTSPLNRLLAAAEAHLRHELEISDYTTAAIRNAGQVPRTIRQRQIREEERYGDVWRGLFNDLAREGVLRQDADPHIMQMLVLGALNWAVEWWDPRRGSIDAVVANAQCLIRDGLRDHRAH